MLNICSEFDGGNIKCLRCESPTDIQLNIRKDNQSEFYQWFYFRLTGGGGRECKLNISNAGDAAYPDGFKGYSAVASYDRDNWFRVKTEFDGNNLLIQCTPELDAIYFAYFAPYSMERHADLVSWACQSPWVNYERLGATLDGQEMDLLKVGDEDKQKKPVWVIARQHPGETMAEWWMEGFLGRLLDENDPVSRELLKLTNLYVVPNMNPDGSRRGHLRTNAIGRNLNREWQEPTPEHSPEVCYVLSKMEQTGVALCFDVHGDEALPYNFIAGPEGTPSWDSVRQTQLNRFKNKLMSINPDFQIKHGYPVSEPGAADMRICTNQIAEKFACLAMTLEMPFKDTIESPNDLYGWSPERCRKLGESNVDALYHHVQREA